MIARGENYLSGYISPSPRRDLRRYELILGNQGSSYWTGSLDQQLRRRGHKVMRYFRCNCTMKQYVSQQNGHIDLDRLEAYWNSVLNQDVDGEASSPICHFSSPTSAATRSYRLSLGNNAYRLRFAQSNFLEFAFGSNETGIRNTDGRPGEVFTNILWEPYLSVLMHDNFYITTDLSGYSGSNEEELKYNTYNGHEEAMYAYCLAMRDRLRRPRDLTVIANLGTYCIYPGQIAGGQGGFKTFGDFIAADAFDGCYFEELVSGERQWWDAPWYHPVLQRLISFRMLFAANKIIIGSTPMLAPERILFFYTGTASPKTFAYNFNTKTLTITLGPNNYHQEITGSTTWEDIRSFLAGCDANMSASLINSGYTNWNAIRPYDVLLPIRPTTIGGSSSSPSYLGALQTPRESLVTVAAAILLAAPRPSNKAYIIGYATGLSNASDYYDNDLFDAFPLLGEPDFDNQPLRTETISGYNFAASWDQVNPDWGHVYYRLFTNGVVFLNWTETDRVISANDPRWGSRNSWFPMARKIDGAYNVFAHPTDKRTAASNAVVVPAKMGEVCFFEV